MKRNIIEGLKIVLLIILVFVMLFMIWFYFVGSYDAYDESVSMGFCRTTAEKSGSKVTKILNDFMYKNEKYYTCVIGEGLPKLYVIDSQGNTLLYKNYQKYVDVMNSLDGIVTVGMYNDELVIVQKLIHDDVLDIYYYDDMGNLIFDLKGMSKDEQGEMVEK